MASNKAGGLFVLPNTPNPGDSTHNLNPASGSRYKHDGQSVTAFVAVTEEYRTAADNRHLAL
jgi:hypothetical protein